MEKDPTVERAEDAPDPEDEGIPDHGGPAPGKRETGDPQEGLLPPTDEARAAEGFGTTAEEQREGEPLDQKLAEELPDQQPPRRTSMGRLIDPGPVDDKEKDEVADEAEEDRSGLSAEEAAVRDEEEPEGLTGGPDQYVQDEET